ncbi:hypothetical protein [Microbacterium halophytorum]|uniref:hypothetical protein n=1 Tax=Microbacterium halophytorum TaxID=2067568 RepID=UPI000CFC16C8|nr:hypothetical protein [Microbacterium halophytorum]
MSTWGTVLAVIGAIVAVIVGWFVLNALLSVMWFAFKLIGALIIGLVIFFAVRYFISRAVKRRNG